MYIYPLVCRREDGYYLAKAPDLPGIVVGEDAIDSLLTEAANACAMWLDDALVKNEPIPAPSAPETLTLEPGEFLSHAIIDLETFRRKYRSQTVRKTVSIPDWMDKEAVRRGVSLSQTLRDALTRRFNHV